MHSLLINAATIPCILVKIERKALQSVSIQHLANVQSPARHVAPQVVEFGRYEMDTWYHAPYPEPYASCSKLYLCEFSLKYFRKKRTLLKHLAKLDARHPPGDEIYRSPSGAAAAHNAAAVADPPISVFEVRRTLSRCHWRLCSRHADTAIQSFSWKFPASLLLSFSHGCPGFLRSHRVAHYSALPVSFHGHRLTAARRRCTARTCACCPSCSWTTRPCTTT